METRKRGVQMNRSRHNNSRSPTRRNPQTSQRHSPRRSHSSPAAHIQKVAQKRRHPLSPGAQSTHGEAFVIDTSIIAGKRLTELITKRGMRGKIIIPDASVAELENQANKGHEVGFDGLDELAKLHELKNQFNLKVEFAPPRPSAHEIRFAKSGEIDALIRSLAYGRSATLVTSDFIQAKSAAAYGIRVWFVRSKQRTEKKSFFSFGKGSWT